MSSAKDKCLLEKRAAEKALRAIEYKARYNPSKIDKTGGVKVPLKAFEHGTGRQLGEEELGKINADILGAAARGEVPSIYKPINQLINDTPGMKNAASDLIADEEAEILAKNTSATGAYVNGQMKLSDHSPAVEGMLRDLHSMKQTADDDVGTMLSKWAPKISEGRIVRFSEYPLVRHVGKYLFYFGSEGSQKALLKTGQPLTVDELRIGIGKETKYRLAEARQNAFLAFLKEQKGAVKGLPVTARFQSELKARFQREVSEIQLLKYNNKPVPDTYSKVLKQYADRDLDAYYKKMHEYASDPGSVSAVGQPGKRDAVKGIDQSEWRPGWMPRFYDDAAMQEIAVQYGADAPAKIFANAMWKARPNYWINKGINSVDELFEHGQVMQNTIQKAAYGIQSTLWANKMTPAAFKQLSDAVLSEVQNPVLKKQLKDWLEDASKEADFTHGFARTILDETATMPTKDGRQLAVRDMMHMNEADLVNRYSSSMDGRIAWAATAIPHPTQPGKWLFEKGIPDDDTYEALRDMILRDIVEKDAEKLKGYSEQSIKDLLFDEIKGLDAFRAYSLGQAMETNKHVGILQNMTAAGYLGAAGLSATVEAPNLVVTHGVNVLRRIPAFGRFKNEIAALGMAKRTDQLNDALSVIERSGGGYRQIMMDSLGMNGMDMISGTRARNNTIAGKVKDKLFHGTAHLARGSLITGGLTPITTGLQRMSEGLQLDRFAHWANKRRTYDALSRKERKQFNALGFSRSETEDLIDMLANKEVFIRSSPGFFELVGARPIIDQINTKHPAFNPQLWHKYVYAQDRLVQNNVIDTSWGGGTRYTNQAWFRQFMSLKSFLLNSYTKSSLRTVEAMGGLGAQALEDIKAGKLIGDDSLSATLNEMKEPVFQFLGQVAAGYLSLEVQWQLRSIAAGDERQADLDKFWPELTETQKIMAAVTRTSMAGLLPTIWNSTGGLLGGPDAVWGNSTRSSGLSNDFFAVPALDLMLRGGKAIGQAGRAAYSEDEYLTYRSTDALAQLPSNQFMWLAIVRMVTDQALELPKQPN